VFFVCVFSVRLLSVLRGHSVFSSPPQRPKVTDRLLSVKLSKLYMNHQEPVFR